MGKVAIAHQKGGVGKTPTTVETVIHGILALAEPHYLTSVSREQLGRDLIEEVRLFGLFSESEMGEVEQYVERLMEEKRADFSTTHHPEQQDH